MWCFKLRNLWQSMNETRLYKSGLRFQSFENVSGILSMNVSGIKLLRG